MKTIYLVLRFLFYSLSGQQPPEYRHYGDDIGNCPGCITKKKQAGG